MNVATGLLDLLTALCGVASLPGTLQLAFMTLGGVLPPGRRAKPSTSVKPFRLAVVIPAHNEELTIQSCVGSLLAADREGIALELVVIADNCTDQTAACAREAGARVLERFSRHDRGKGYALHFAFTRLLDENPQAIAVVDADTAVAPNFLTEMAALLEGGADAVQARYAVRCVDDSPRSRLTRLASGAFNILRPRARNRLGFSAGLYGNGFALSAQTAREVPYSACSVVEDVEYHMQLVRAGKRVQFADGTWVCAGLPGAGSEGAKTQRARWEGGRFRMLATEAPGLALDALRGRWPLVEPLFDLLLLPLAFHTALLLLAALSPWLPLRIAACAGLGIVLLHLLAAIRVTGGGRRELAALTAAPFYILWKICLLPRLLKGARTDAAWVRTERISARHGLR